MTSAWNHGSVNSVIPGNAFTLHKISNLIWFLRKRGCRIMSWLNMNLKERAAKMK